MIFSSSGFCDVFQGVENMLLKSPYLRKLIPEDLEQHLRWYWARGTMSWARESEGGEYTGVCLIKIFDALEDMDNLYVHDPSGQYLKIEEVVSHTPDTWRQLFDQLYGIWGSRKIIIFDRRDRTKNCPRIYTWQQYLKVLRRLTHGYEPT